MHFEVFVRTTNIPVAYSLHHIIGQKIIVKVFFNCMYNLCYPQRKAHLGRAPAERDSLVRSPKSMRSGKWSELQFSDDESRQTTPKPTVVQ